MTALPHAALALALVLPGLAAAEGARRVFACETGDGTIARFVIEPLTIDATGKGPIRVTYGETTYDGVSASDRGPFQFGAGSEHFALLFHGETDDGRLAAQLHHATAHSSTLTSMICETDF